MFFDTFKRWFGNKKTESVVEMDKHNNEEELTEQAIVEELETPNEDSIQMNLFNEEMIDTTHKNDVYKDAQKNNGDRNIDILKDTVYYFTNLDNKKLLNQENRKLISREILLNEVRNHVIKTHKLTEIEADEIIELFVSYMWGYYIIDPLIEDDEISDIKVLAPDRIRVKKKGKRFTVPSSELSFKDKEDYIRFIDMVATKNTTSIAQNNAIKTFTDNFTSDKFILRFNVATEYVNSVDYPYLHIRKVAKKKVTVDTLIERKMMSREVANLLIEKWKNNESILFCGKGASGKTTLMNALLEETPHEDSALIIQENEELFSDTHPDMMFQHIVTNVGEGKIQYELSDLARNGLLTDLDRFIIGECKGGEALYLLNAVYTGHCAMTSIHANNALTAHDKLADYVKYSSDYSKQDALQMLAAFSTVVFMKDYKVKEIAEVIGWDNNDHRLQFNRIV